MEWGSHFKCRKGDGQAGVSGLASWSWAHDRKSLHSGPAYSQELFVSEGWCSECPAGESEGSHLWRELPYPPANAQTELRPQEKPHCNGDSWALEAIGVPQFCHLWVMWPWASYFIRDPGWQWHCLSGLGYNGCPEWGGFAHLTPVHPSRPRGPVPTSHISWPAFLGGLAVSCVCSICLILLMLFFKTFAEKVPTVTFSPWLSHLCPFPFVCFLWDRHLTHGKVTSSKQTTGPKCSCLPKDEILSALLQLSPAWGYPHTQTWLQTCLNFLVLQADVSFLAMLGQIFRRDC